MYEAERTFTIDGIIDGLTVERALKEYGSPLFIVLENVLRERFQFFINTLKAHYENSAVAYSFKTNYLRRVCATLKDEGALAEVVSGFEYGLARSLGYEGKDIIFNGPHKTRADLETALSEGALIHVDNMEEIQRIRDIGSATHRDISIALRLSSSDIADVLRRGRRNSMPERFGFDLDNGDAEAAYAQIKASGPQIRIAGLHMHIASDVKDPRIFINAANKVVEFARRIESETETPLLYIDMGGGLPDPDLRRDKDRFPFGRVPPLEEFLSGVAGVIKEGYTSHQPLLLFEPGRYLISRSVIHATRVISVKHIKARQVVTVDTSASVLPTVKESRHRVTMTQPSAGRETVPTVIAGSSCMAHDIFGEYFLPILHAGDVLVIENCGAYTVSLSAQFITPRPAIVWIDKNGGMSLARRAETPEDLTRLDTA